MDRFRNGLQTGSFGASVLTKEMDFPVVVGERNIHSGFAISQVHWRSQEEAGLKIGPSFVSHLVAVYWRQASPIPPVQAMMLSMKNDQALGELDVRLSAEMMEEMRDLLGWQGIETKKTKHSMLKDSDR